MDKNTTTFFCIGNYWPSDPDSLNNIFQKNPIWLQYRYVKRKQAVTSQSSLDPTQIENINVSVYCQKHE
jgi:hypothetical protein